MPNNNEPKSLDQMHPSKNVQSTGKSGMSIAERNMQAAIERAEEREAQAKAAEAQAEAERKNDGRKYDLEVEGFNIGDSLVRRMEFLNEKAASTQDQIAEEDLEREVEGTDEDEDDITDENIEEEDVEEDSDDMDADEFDFGEDTSLDINEDLGVEEDEEPEEEPAPVATKDPEVVRAEKAIEGIAKTAAPADEDNNNEKLSEKPLPNQGETVIDEEDLDGIDLDIDDTPSTDDDEDASMSEKEMEDLRNEIRSKISGKLPSADKIKIVDKPVSVNQLLNVDSAKKKAADWPMMNAGVCVSMSAFSGPEIEALNQSISGRNRFNTMKDIYRSLYNHIVSEKPSFEDWLKQTSYMDIEHIYMAAYKASFNGANYIPLNCDNCDHVFLTEDVDIEESMVKFKDDAAKKRFYDILNSGGSVAAKDRTKFIVLSDTTAVTLRDPSIYNTIFENSVLDDKFVDKYEKLLTMMVYIDKMYLIDAAGNARPIAVKEDKHSLAKTCKYRIATYAKVINAMPSDAYSTLLAEIAKMNDADEEVKYQFPEVTCPKCHETIEASEATAQQLLFNRHRLNLLTAQ